MNKRVVRKGRRYASVGKRSRPRFHADVEWVSPITGQAANMDKLLSLDPSITDDTGYVTYENISGSEERYIFKTKKAAEAFKTRAEKMYRENPQFHVINDEGEEVLDEYTGKPIVAWEPHIVITKSTRR